MLNLIYDEKCGFKDYYITERNVKISLDHLFEVDYRSIPEEAFIEDDYKLPTEQDVENFYNYYKDKPEELREYLDACGELAILEEMTIEQYAHTVFKDICFPKKGESFHPGYFEMNNLRLEYIKNKKAKDPNYIKAGEVMEILNISRNTLSTYVKENKLEYIKEDGKQYKYLLSSVYNLLK